MAIVYSILSLCLVGFLFIRLQTTERQLKQIQQRLDDSERAREEVEQSLFVFADEIKEGNERVLQQVANHLDSNSHANDSTFETITEEANKLEPEPYQPPMPTNHQEQKQTYHQSPQAMVLSLHNQGMSSNDIAKKMNMGKGEVDLIIKFQQ